MSRHWIGWASAAWLSMGLGFLAGWCFAALMIVQAGHRLDGESTAPSRAA